MAIHKVEIGGVVLGNVGDINTEPIVEYKLNVRTLDGVLHQEILYKVENHTVLFFNLLDGVYDWLKDYINTNKGRNIECGIPADNSSEFVYGDYRLSIVKEINKGYLRGQYFRNGLQVLFEAVKPNA